MRAEPSANAIAAAVKKIPPLGWLALVAAIGAGAYAVFGDGHAGPAFEEDDLGDDDAEDEAA